ncbi:TAXI family TRAP transporter solute-binding subunit [bacterium]|nr:TAXI family TRAP transporter solute-binding subunit [bacterium]
MNYLKYLSMMAVFFIAGCGGQAPMTFLTIGTGGVTGVYYPTGGAIAKLINQKSSDYKIKATVESTAGSVYNVNAVLSGDIEVGIVQSDRQYQAYHGVAEWETRGAQKKLRALFSIHPESITLIATVKSSITQVGDLKGKRVNLGNPGSGQLQNSKDTLQAFGLTTDDIRAEYVKAVEAPGLLQDGRIDAFFYTVGHPAGNIKEATSGRIKVNMINITGKPVDALVKQYSYYARSIIPAALYPAVKNDTDCRTFGVKATVVSSADVDEAIVYAITKEVFGNLEAFKQMHPAYQVLTKENMLEGLSAPIHSGAMKYYKEAGLDKFIDPESVVE